MCVQAETTITQREEIGITIEIEEIGIETEDGDPTVGIGTTQGGFQYSSLLFIPHPISPQMTFSHSNYL